MVGLCQSGCVVDGYKLVIVCVCVCVFSQGLARTHENNDADKTHRLGLCYGKSVCACVCVCVFSIELAFHLKHTHSSTLSTCGGYL